MDRNDRHSRPITCQGIGAFDPGLDPGKEWAKGGVRLRGPSPWSGEGPERQIERSARLHRRKAKDPKGNPSAPPGFASGTRKTRKATGAFSVWLRQRNAKEKPLPVQDIKPFRRVPPAPPKEGPFDRGIWVNPVFAGVDNEPYYLDRALMLLGEAKSFVGELVKEVQAQVGQNPA